MKTTLKLIFSSCFLFLLTITFFSCKKESRDTQPPAEVNNLLAFPGDSTVTLTWTDPVDKDLSMIEITFDGQIQIVPKGIGVKKITLLQNGNACTFTIKTMDESGNKSHGVIINETPDYRYRFTGDFTFTTIRENWMLGQPTTYDTLVYDGHIKIYVNGDNLKDLSSFDNPDEHDSLRITIEFLNNTFITPEISEAGVLINKSGYHYGHSGSFSTMNTIGFYVGGLGGLGGGTNLNTQGLRK